MAFSNITTLYVPTAGNAGSSQWGTDVRKLLDSADADSDSTTKTDHGTGGAVNRTIDPYTTSSADGTEGNYGWAITPTDMNSVSGARRFYPAGTHSITIRMGHNGATGATGTLRLFAFRVASAASGRTRTQLGSGSTSVALPALAGEVTATVGMSLAEVIFEPDETIQYNLEYSVAGIAISGRVVTYFTGTQSSVVAKIDTPKLGVLADTDGTASGTGAATGAGGLVLGTVGTAAGTGAASGVMSSTATTTGTASGTGAASGAMSSIAGTVGSASGTGSASGATSIVLGTVGTVSIGADTPDWPVSSATRSIAGTVLHHETGDAVAGATVRLYRVTDNKMVQSTTSAADGSYSFERDTDDPYTYFVSADYDDSGTQVHGLSDRDLVPA